MLAKCNNSSNLFSGFDRNSSLIKQNKHIKWLKTKDDETFNESKTTSNSFNNSSSQSTRIVLTGAHRHEDHLHTGSRRLKFVEITRIAKWRHEVIHVLKYIVVFIGDLSVHYKFWRMSTPVLKMLHYPKQVKLKGFFNFIGSLRALV